jgi:hypothetical protein
MSNVRPLMQVYAGADRFMPSRATTIRAALASLVASGLWLYLLWPRFVCAAEQPSCTDLAALGAGSIALGIAYGLAYACVAVVLGALVVLVKPQARVLEPSRKALPVTLVLFGLQVAVVGVIALAGALPAKWPWWLGAFGALAL